MRKPLASLAALITFAASANFVSAQMPAFHEIPAPAFPGTPIALRVENPTPAAQPESWVGMGAAAFVRNVSAPTLTPILPPKDKATGAAVIVAPGGAFLFLSMKSEGYDVAQSLADHGIAAFVLKYRVNPTPADMQAFSTQLTTILTGAAQQPATQDGLKAPAPAVADAQAALRLVRSRAPEWGIDPHRVGLLGFSAGAMTTLGVIQADAKEATPDFAGTIYPPMNSMTIPADVPPMFTALAADDPLFAGKGYGLIETWQKAKKPIEFHLYEAGGHGFAGRHGDTYEHWFDEFVWWMEARNLLKH